MSEIWIGRLDNVEKTRRCLKFWLPLNFSMRVVARFGLNLVSAGSKAGADRVACAWLPRLCEAVADARLLSQTQFCRDISECRHDIGRRIAGTCLRSLVLGGKASSFKVPSTACSCGTCGLAVLLPQSRPGAAVAHVVPCPSTYRDACSLDC